MNRYINTSLNKVLDVKKKKKEKCLSYHCLCANVEEYLFYIGIGCTLFEYDKRDMSVF